MIKIRHRLRCLLLLIFLFGIQQPLLSAQATKAKASTDIRVLVDMSGSMKSNDPENLRVPAIQLMSNLLPPDSQAGVWTFGQYVNMLVPLKPVDTEWKKFAIKAAEKINSSGLYTNIGGAMERASFGWNTTDPNVKRSLILLTDGMVDISKDAAENAAARRKVMNELLPLYKAAGITIHTIALSGDADEKLLSKMASETDGWYQKVNHADELQKVFLKIFEQATERDSIPLKDNLFVIDEQIEEFTILAFKKKDSKPTLLEQPDGEKYDAAEDNERITWFESEDYDLITINAPMPGEWRLHANIDPDNRVLVVSNLKLKSTALANNMLANEKFVFSMHLLQDGGIVTESDFLELLTMEVELTGADGKESLYKVMDDGLGVDETAGDGIYSIELEAPPVPGISQLSAWVESPTFQRMRQQATNVFSSPVTISEELSTDIEVEHKLVLTPYNAISKPDSLVISAEVQLPDKQKLSLLAGPHKGYSQAINIPAVGTGGVYWVQLVISGESPSGRKYKVTPPIYQFIVEPILSTVVEEPEIVEEEVTEVIEEETEVNTALWVAIGFAINLLLIGIGWFVFRMIKQQNLTNAIKISKELE